MRRKLKITELSPGGYASCCYLLQKGDTAVLIDCTVNAEVLKSTLSRTHASLAAILLTHGHFDHMLTLAEVKRATGAPILLGEGDKDFPADGEKNAHSVFFGGDACYPTPDRLLSNGDVLTFGDISLRVMNTPGHTPGSTVLLSDGVAFTGDTIFAAGYGRYDLFGGDGGALRHSLSSLSALPPSTVIYPGHGKPTTLGEALSKLF